MPTSPRYSVATWMTPHNTTLEDIEQVGWREGRFPGGAIDREQHRSYSLFMEARR